MHVPKALTSLLHSSSATTRSLSLMGSCGRARKAAAFAAELDAGAFQPPCQ